MKIKILVTGVTGLLGSCTVVELLEKSPEAELLFLVRASDQKAGLERVRKSLGKAGAQSQMLAGLSEAQVLCGELGSAAQLASDPRVKEVTQQFFHLQTDNLFGNTIKYFACNFINVRNISLFVNSKHTFTN
jgi:thioester reductase-like protein